MKARRRSALFALLLLALGVVTFILGHQAAVPQPGPAVQAAIAQPQPGITLLPNGKLILGDGIPERAALEAFSQLRSPVAGQRISRPPLPAIEAPTMSDTELIARIRLAEQCGSMLPVIYPEPTEADIRRMVELSHELGIELPLDSETILPPMPYEPTSEWQTNDLGQQFMLLPPHVEPTG